MWYNTHVRKNIGRILVIVLVVTSVGCAGSVTTINTHINNREFYYNRYIEECVAVSGEAPASCEAVQVALNGYKNAVIEAEAAKSRGGKFPLQMKALREWLKKVKNARDN